LFEVALISKASFEENLRKSMMSRRSADNVPHNFSIADRSEVQDTKSNEDHEDPYED